ncbi:MAG: hypothetical protein QM763_24880 [Agriterribacter sp.]
MEFAPPGDDFSATIFFLLELAKGIFLAEVHIFQRLFTLAQHKKHYLLNIYKFLGSTDMHISIASVLSDSAIQTCHPVLSDKEGCLQFENASHPVIDNYLPNSLAVCSKSVLVTHDLEIAGSVSKGFDEYHFAESIVDGKLHFNYTLNKGRLKTRNAINLAKFAGYPETVVNDAAAMVERLLSPFNTKGIEVYY